MVVLITSWLIYVKKYNPGVKVYCKLDMGESGFSHFHEKGIGRKIKNYLERIKSKYVDLFTVETKYYYDELKDNAMFSGGRLQYLPNGVSCLGVNVEDIDKIEKENIILTVGRLGTYEKNNELLLESIKRVNPVLLKNWHVYFVGPVTEDFKVYVEEFLKDNEAIRDRIVFTGAITDRTELYSLYARSKIMCMTSRTESFCIATAEGMYFGCVPVLTDYGKITIDQTDNNRLGAIVRNGDANALSKQLEYYMAHQDILEDLIPKCKSYAREWFNYKRIAELLDGYLRNIM